MKSKAYALLCMCNDLKKGKGIELNETCKEYNISERTFRRYISELKFYFMEEESTDVFYDTKTNKYKI